MNWEEKMNYIIQSVLGNEYRIEIVDDFKFNTLFMDEIINETETLLDIPSHWKKHISDMIEHIIKFKIAHAISNINELYAIKK